MTAKTSQKLADALRAAGLPELAIRAEHNEFHDFLSPHDLPEMMLDMELVAVIQSGDEKKREAAQRLRERHHEGEFDASKEESDEWARSSEGQATFSRLMNDL